MIRRKKIRDPYHEREAQKYPNPIPSRECIAEIVKERGAPISWDELTEALNLHSDEELEALRRRLRAMERDGQLAGNRRGGYGLIDKMDLICGRVIGHREGYGFVVPDDGEGIKNNDIFLSARYMRAVFDNDRVLVRVTGNDSRGRREGALVEVLQRNTPQVVGRFFVEEGSAFVTPENKRISQDIGVLPGEEKGAKAGQIVMIEITAPPTLHHQGRGRIVEVLGNHMAAGMETDVAVRAYGLSYLWPEEVQKEVAKYSLTIPEQAIQDRVDVRHLPLVTIDGEDAKDFDDAIHCKKRPQGGWTLYVAIADVSYYVHPNTALDQEAKLRGNSVYFPGRTIPMLPEILSNELCSLKARVDRLCMVCEMQVTEEGKLSRYQFYPAVMCSQARLTYTEVASQLEGRSKTIQKRCPDIVPHLEELNELYKTLRTNREARGAIDFETIETRVVFGAQRKIKEIVPTVRTIAHRIVEECMLIANVATARFLEKHKMPALYRVHSGPTPEKLADLRVFLKELGLGLRGDDKPEPKDYAALLATLGERPDRRLIQTVLLRSLSQAFYSPKNAGHFGLAYEVYAHFTSPIRRYPDLLVHRAIRHVLSKKPVKEFEYDVPRMAAIGESCSIAERRADNATHDALNWLKCEFVMDRVGQEFNGLITGVTAFGIFVELENIYVEGLVHITGLKNDYYHFDHARHRLSGERTGTVYRLGDCVRVKVVRVDLDNKNIDLELVQSKTQKKAKR